MRILSVALLSIALATFLPKQQSLLAQRPPEIQITEWTVPWEKSRPRDPYIDPKGRAWFVGQTGNYVANLDPVSGKFERIDRCKPCRQLSDGAFVDANCMARFLLPIP